MSFRTVLGASAVAAALVAATPATSAPTVSPNVVISEVYGGGGNAGAPYNADFVELHNRSHAAVDLTNWSIQQAAATGSTWTKVIISGCLNPAGCTIAAHGYFLVKVGAAGAVGSALPGPDVDSSAISAAASAGKIVLVNNDTTITAGTSCPADATIVDKVGYGTTATCFEGSGPAPAPSNTTSAQRKATGWLDTDDNATDLLAAPPAPQNSLSPTSVVLSSFTATRAGAKVTLRWRTLSEAAVLGFNVYTARGGKRVKLNTALIQARGSLTGHAYSWSGTARGTRFWLETVSVARAHTLRVATAR